MITSLFLAVVEISVSVSLTALMLILTAPLLNRRYAVKWKYFIWIFLAFRLLVPFSGDEIRSVMDEAVDHAISGDWQKENAADVMPLNDEKPRQRIIVEIPWQMTEPIAASAGNNSWKVSLLDILALVWLGGCLCILTFYLFSYIYYRVRLKRAGIWVTDSAVLNQQERLLAEMKIKKHVPVAEYAGAASPMVIGFAKPVLVLPEGRYNEEKLYYVLKHELVHQKRHDVYFKLLFAAAGAVHWFNPVIWLMQKEAVADMELSCDERVIQGAGFAEKKAYTEALVSALCESSGKKSVLSTQFYGGKKIMKRRFENIFVKADKKNGVLLFVCAAVLTAGMGTLTGCSVADHEQSAVGNIAVTDDFIHWLNNLKPSDLPEEEVSLIVSDSSEAMAESIFWRLDEVQGEGGANVLEFSTGLQLILPAGWGDRVELSVAPGEDGSEETLILSTKDKTEAGVGKALLYLRYVDGEGYDEDTPYSIYGRDTDRVLGVYSRSGKEYALIFEVPQLFYQSSAAEMQAYSEICNANHDLSETIGDVRIVTDNMQDFTECGLEDLDWIVSWSEIIEALD